MIVVLHVIQITGSSPVKHSFAKEKTCKFKVKLCDGSALSLTFDFKHYWLGLGKCLGSLGNLYDKLCILVDMQKEDPYLKPKTKNNLRNAFQICENVDNAL